MKPALRSTLLFALGALGTVAVAEALATRPDERPRHLPMIWLGACSLGLTAAVAGSLRRT